ncbi:Uncharacterised protein [Klebsiella pneumoniae]|uniref:Uncharacterized protein n=1 Tax=Klebsiella quasivariicola TaxID=2026240 RepID=A0A8B4TWN2_9ENTR|nr:Uncharacterised protein [Klebsiella pneumoniae]SXD95441.1 Uncharacterised protein [Klebsiella quasivariicola]SAR56858.1 Uncharacterised protein [Klebsiella pneumoniae]SVW41495.1 Uncharacterised protein [Klebsiella pneumoniae]SWN26533.1 Uncharacterised protein [Klebsiella pneumoniae]
MKDENDPEQLDEMTKKLTEYLRKKVWFYRIMNAN